MMETVLEVGSDFLAHYGVKGMRWGVRNEDKKWAKSGLNEQQQQAVKAALAHAVDRVNYHYNTNGISIKDSKVRKQYVADIRAAVEDNFDRLMNDPKVNKYFSPESPTGQFRWNLTVKPYGPFGFTYHADPVRVSHAEASEPTEIVGLIQFEEDENGFFVNPKLLPLPDAAAQALDFGTDFLAHYGVKGMKWGIRNDRRKLAKDDPIKNLSDDELRSIINRMNLEQQYRQAVATSKNTRGSRFLRDSIDTFGRTGVKQSSDVFWRWLFMQIAPSVVKTKKKK